MQVRRSYAAWLTRASARGEGLEVASFEQLVPALHDAIEEAALLDKLAPDHRAIRKLSDWLDWMLNTARRWISDLDAPAKRQTPMADVVAQELDLLDWPQQPPLQRGVRELAGMFDAWPPESTDYFRQVLYETAIDLDILRTVSASHSADNVARNVQQLLYRTMGGKDPAEHERREINLAESIARKSDIYASPILPVFLAALSRDRCVLESVDSVGPDRRTQCRARRPAAEGEPNPP